MKKLTVKQCIISGVLSAVLTVSTCAYAQQQTSSNQLSLTAMQPQGEGAAADANAIRPSELFSTPSTQQQQAFQSVTRQAMPMTPDEIKHLKRMLTATQQAAASPAGLPPRPVTSSIMVSMSPGVTPPVIRLQQGFISSLVFVDASGHKWPVDGYDVGNPSAFNIEWQKGGDSLLVQATSMFTYGNLAVKLRGLSTPVMLTLIPGQRVVDYRVDLHVQGVSPTAPAALTGNGLPAQASNTLLNVLNGIPPVKSKTLTVTGGRCEVGLNNCRAWSVGNKLYLRIPMAILSPSWMSKMQSSDGMYAYEMQKTPSVLVSDYGRSTQLSIGGY